MIFSEYPIVKYPQWKTSPLCLGCYAPIELNQCFQCKICNWPMCSEKCCYSLDHVLECGIFQKCGIKLDINELKSHKAVVPLYDIIIPLRMLALKFQKNQESWEKLMNLESHKVRW